MPEEKENLQGRNGEIWRLYVRGWTQDRLAAEYGISQARVSQIIKQVRDGIPELDRAEEVQKSLDMLQELRRTALEIMDMKPAPVFVGKDGDVAIDPDGGEVVRDYAGRINALKTALAVDQRIATLLGLDAAQKLDMSLSTGEAQAAEKLAAEAARRVTGDLE